MTDYVAKLPNAPLQEVIFEIHWELDIDEGNNQMFDPRFELAQGVFAEKINKGFSFYRRIVPANLPIQLLHKPIHQFWKSEDSWPVVQLGQGILTVNDTEKNYVWKETFKPLIQSTLNSLLDSYNNQIRFNHISLRYIDAVELTEKKGLLDFINKNLQINIQKRFDISGELSDISLSETYTLEDDSKLGILINNGRKEVINRPALIWQIVVFKNGIISADSIESWLENAHFNTSDLFRKMLNKDFYDSFK